MKRYLIIFLVATMPAFLYAGGVQFGFGSSSDATIEKEVNVAENIPDKIYLQTDKNGETLTWSRVRVKDSDIEYIKNPLDGKDQSQIAKTLRIGRVVIEALGKLGLEIK